MALTDWRRYLMSPTRPKTGVVDELIDRAGDARSDALGDALTCRAALRDGLREMVKAHNAATMLVQNLAGREVAGVAPGPLFLALAELRQCPAIRRARKAVTA